MISHSEMLDGLQNGKLLIGVDPAYARRFYADLTDKERNEAIGDARTQEAAFVRGIHGFDAVLFLLTAISAGFAFKYWAIPIIPAVWVSWFMLKGDASMGSTRFIGAIVLCIIFWSLAFIYREHGHWQSLFFILIPLIYTMSLTAYRIGAWRLRNLAINNDRAYEFMADRPSGKRGVIIIDRTTREAIETEDVQPDNGAYR